MAIIIPDVYSEILTEKVKGKVRISGVADTIGTLSDFNEEGDSITFPKFSALDDAELLARGATIKTEELKQTSSKKQVKHYAKGVSILDIDAKEGKGNFLDNAIEQQADIFARARDKEMVDDIDTNALLKLATSNATEVLESELISALQLFGDEQDNEDFAGIFINSLLLKSFYTMDGFTSTTRTYVNPENGQIVNGVIGFYRGTIPVILTDRNTFDAKTKECKTYIVKKHSLGIKDKTKGVNIETDRVASAKKTDIYADEMFACGLVQTDGVVIMRKTIA